VPAAARGAPMEESGAVRDARSRVIGTLVIRRLDVFNPGADSQQTSSPAAATSKRGDGPEKGQ
jgi:hypothetical protein